jgi:predicted DNA-binding transcriptional regulator AlpA
MGRHTTRTARRHSPDPLLPPAGALILRTPAAARALGLGVPTLEKMRLRGDGPPFIRLGPKCVGYRPEDLRAWLETRRVTSTSAAVR